MVRLFSLFFLFIFSTVAWSESLVFQGRVDLGREIDSFSTDPPVLGTLYVLTGVASRIKVLSENPFVAEIVFLQAKWLSDSVLDSAKTTLRFEGAKWASLIVDRKPREGADRLVYPYRKFQVAALASDHGFRVQAITNLF